MIQFSQVLNIHNSRWLWGDSQKLHHPKRCSIFNQRYKYAACLPSWFNLYLYTYSYTYIYAYIYKNQTNKKKHIYKFILKVVWKHNEYEIMKEIRSGFCIFHFPLWKCKRIWSSNPSVVIDFLMWWYWLVSFSMLETGELSPHCVIIFQ